MRIVIFLFALFLCSCALFQKTSKESLMQSQSSANQLKSTQLVLKNTAKETQIYTYWNDSGFYQYQHIKEQVDQKEQTKLKLEEKQQVKQTLRTKVTAPAANRIFLAAGILLVLCVYAVRKFFLRKAIG